MVVDIGHSHGDIASCRARRHAAVMTEYSHFNTVLHLAVKLTPSLQRVLALVYLNQSEVFLSVLAYTE